MPPPRMLPDADDPANEFTFNENPNLATVNERTGSSSVRGKPHSCLAARQAEAVQPLRMLCTWLVE
jgi:hypothetical protein